MKKPAKGGFCTDAITGECWLRSGHEHGDESQQKNQNRTGSRNNDGNVFHHSFDWIGGLMGIVVCGHSYNLKLQTIRYYSQDILGPG